MPYQYYYLDYIDKATGKTLVVTPGSAYTVAVASGRNTAMPSFPNDGRWTNSTTFSNLVMEVPLPGESGKEAKIAVNESTGAVQSVTGSSGSNSNKEGA